MLTNWHPSLLSSPAESSVNDVDLPTNEVTGDTSALHASSYSDKDAQLFERELGLLEIYNVPCPTCQINHSTSEVLRDSPSPCRHSSQYHCLFLFIASDTRRQLRRDIARRERSHTNALSHPLVAQGLGELANGTLCSNVGADLSATTERKNGSNVDYFFLIRSQRRRSREPVFGKGSSEDKGRCQVDLDDLRFSDKL